MFLKSNYLTSLSKIVSEDISRVQYKVSGSWHDVERIIKSQENNCLTISAIFPDMKNAAVGGIRFMDSSGNVIAEKAENILTAAGNKLVLQFKIHISERSGS